MVYFIQLSEKVSLKETPDSVVEIKNLHQREGKTPLSTATAVKKNNCANFHTVAFPLNIAYSVCIVNFEATPIPTMMKVIAVLFAVLAVATAFAPMPAGRATTDLKKSFFDTVR
jgi:hypothetical protein